MTPSTSGVQLRGDSAMQRRQGRCMYAGQPDLAATCKSIRQVGPPARHTVASLHVVPMQQLVAGSPVADGERSKVHSAVAERLELC